MFAASRNLYALAITGHAPTIFARCSKRGIPYVAVCAVTALTLLSFLLLSEKSSVVRVSQRIYSLIRSFIRADFSSLLCRSSPGTYTSPRVIPREQQQKK